jgi:hypothetical protein
MWVFVVFFIGGLALLIWPGPYLYSHSVNRYPPEQPKEKPVDEGGWVCVMIVAGWLGFILIARLLEGASLSDLLR